MQHGPRWVHLIETEVPRTSYHSFRTVHLVVHMIYPSVNPWVIYNWLKRSKDNDSFWRYVTPSLNTVNLLLSELIRNQVHFTQSLWLCHLILSFLEKTLHDLVKSETTDTRHNVDIMCWDGNYHTFLGICYTFV